MQLISKKVSCPTKNIDIYITFFPNAIDRDGKKNNIVCATGARVCCCMQFIFNDYSKTCPEPVTSTFYTSNYI